jgi:hypothetical protein
METTGSGSKLSANCPPHFHNLFELCASSSAEKELRTRRARLRHPKPRRQSSAVRARPEQPVCQQASAFSVPERPHTIRAIIVFRCAGRSAKSGAPGDRQRAKVKVPNRKGIANQTGSESCVAHREVRDEALTGSLQASDRAAKMLQ